jgi:hypothetical protein
MDVIVQYEFLYLILKREQFEERASQNVTSYKIDKQ